jgi:hypothetical protein
MPLKRFPLDVRLPELAVAADPHEMMRMFAEHVWPRAESRLEVEACRISGVRYRRHARCSLQYAVILRDRTTAQATHQWVTGALFAEPGRAAELLRRETTAVTCTVPDIMPAAFIPELRMVVSVFPHDRKLPQACVLATGRDALLDAAVLSAFGPGSWTIEGWTAVPVRYVEHVSLEVKYTVTARDARTGEADERIFCLKAFRDPRHTRVVHERLERLARYASQHPVGVRIDPPLALLPHLQAILLHGGTGRSLDVVLGEADDAAAIAAVCEAAKALAMFHLSVAPTDQIYTKAQQHASLQRASRLLEYACPERVAEVRGILSALKRHPVGDTEVRPTHRSMTPKHIVMGGDLPAFLDLESCAASDPLIDVAQMLARLTARGYHTATAKRVRLAAAAFNGEYFSHVPADWRERLRTRYAATLIETAADIFRSQEYAWTTRVTTLIREATLVLGGAPLPGDPASI